MIKIWKGRMMITTLTAAIYITSASMCPSSSYTSTVNIKYPIQRIVFGILTVVANCADVPDLNAREQPFFLGFAFTTILFNACTTLAIGYRTLPLFELKRKPTIHSRHVGGQTWRAGVTIWVFLENGLLYTLIGITQAVLSLHIDGDGWSRAQTFSLALWQISVVCCHSLRIFSLSRR